MSQYVDWFVESKLTRVLGVLLLLLFYFFTFLLPGGLTFSYLSDAKIMSGLLLPNFLVFPKSQMY